MLVSFYRKGFPMTTFTTYLNPLLGRVSGCVSLAMLFDLLRALPRPLVGGPVAYGRQMILDALAEVDAWAPRDRFEAALALQIPTLLLAGRAAEAAARVEADWDRRMRLERHVMTSQRRAEALGREIRRHRKDLAAEGLVHVSPPGFVCDADALEAVWRDLERALPEAVLTPEVEAVPAGFGGAAVGPDGVLEARDEFEAEPLPAFKGVPKWKQAGRKYLDELLEEERDELIAVQLRGETIEEPPQRVEDYIEP
jgi:hypothetical protein